jgi:hypothetical protein
MAVVWGVAPYCLLDIGRRFRYAYCLYHQGEISWFTSESSAHSVNVLRDNFKL